MPGNFSQAPLEHSWDHSSDINFVDYYEQRSLNPETVQRFTSIRDKALKLLATRLGHSPGNLHVADIGCGTGMQSQFWAKLGHHAHGLDVNASLIDIARRRASEAGMNIPFDIGSATELPYADSSMDVVLLPELLEHVAEWRRCLDEAIRVLKPGGLLYLSTTNWLCPVQQEFNRSMYSWYPAFLKRHYEKLAVTTRPDLANYCRYPAVNWFSYYTLAGHLENMGLQCWDRFDMIETQGKSPVAKTAVRLIRAIPPLRFVGHVFTPGSTVFALKGSLTPPEQ